MAPSPCDANGDGSIIQHKGMGNPDGQGNPDDVHRSARQHLDEVRSPSPRHVLSGAMFGGTYCRGTYCRPIPICING